MSYTAKYLLSYPEAPDLEPETAGAGEFFPVPRTPVRDGYSFSGWFYDPECTKPCRIFRDRAWADRTLYAGWEAPAADYTEAFLASRAASTHFLAYTDESIVYLELAQFETEFVNPYSRLLEAAFDPPAELRPAFEHLRYAVSQLVQIHPLEYRCTDLWQGKPIPKVAECEDQPECPQACLQDDPGFRPFIMDMRLPEPELAKGTVIISPSVRGGRHELMLTARKWQSMGYNCFAVSPRFNTMPRVAGSLPSRSGFLFPYSFPEELLDTQRAIRYVRANATELGIDADRLISIGFSKGNCIHFVSSSLFDLKPSEVRFMKADGSYSTILPGYEDDEIDSVYANVSANIFVYGDMMICPDMKEPQIASSRIYSTANREKGLYFPACYIVAGNYDRINFRVAEAIHEHNASREKLYEIPYELHIYDKVPHGVGMGEEFTNYFRTWENADIFCRMSFERS